MSDTTNPSGVSDSDVGHVFDQTNGVVDALDGESGGTAAGDTASAGDRDEAVPTESDAATASAASAGATTDRPGDDAADLSRPEPAERTEDDATDDGVTGADEFAVDRSGTATAVATGPAGGDGSASTSLTADGDDGIVGHVFDQTNGVADGLSGDSDGSAESDIASAGERANDDPTFDDATVRDADEGVEDLDRRNP